MTASSSAPKIVIAQERMATLEAVADAMQHRSPELAEHLVEELARAKLVALAQMPPDIVDIGSTVTFLDETANREQTITLVLPEQADIGAGKASVATPIGVALLGLKAGARFGWEARDGKKRKLHILSVTAASLSA